MRTNGIEPSRDCSHGLLRPARLPVPPRPRKKGKAYDTNLTQEVQERRSSLVYLSYAKSFARESGGS